MGKGAALVLAVAALFGLAAPTAHATFPGFAGQVAYTYSDGTNSWLVREGPGVRVALAGPADHPAYPAWSPDKLAVAYAGTQGGNTDIYTVSWDGTRRTRLTTDAASDTDPAWSPDGGRIAFASDRSGAYALCVINADGTGENCLTDSLGQPLSGQEPNWSPDGQKLLFVRSGTLWTVHPDGSGLTQLTITGLQGGTCCDFRPDWSPDGQKIVFGSTRQVLRQQVILANADGSGASALDYGEDPVWAPDGSWIAFVGHCPSNPGPDTCIERMRPFWTSGGIWIDNLGYDDTAPTWGSFDPQQEPRYVRPRGATPLELPLVPAFDECTGPNRSHGAPLAFDSCAPPVQSSAKLTFGTPDANGQPVNSTGFFELRAIVDKPATATDESDVRIDASLTDVRCRGSGDGCAGGALSDYTGDLVAQMFVSITDNDRISQADQSGMDSTSNGYFGVSMPCAATSATNVGSTCSIATSVDALYPPPAPPPARQALMAGKRAIWAPHDIAILDNSDYQGGQPLAVPGLFVP